MRSVFLTAWLRRILARLGRIRPSRHADEDLDREIAAHLALLEEDYRRRGLSPAEAHTAARRALGGIEQTKQAHRDQRSLLWLEYILQDLRFALRSLRRTPGYATAVILTLALGLGSVATMLAVVDSVLLRPVPLAHPRQLVMIYGKTAQQGGWDSLSFDQIRILGRDTHLFSSVAGFATTVKPVGTGDGTRWALLAPITPDFFQTLGVAPYMGRLFTDEDANRRVVLVSYEFWQERLHGDPHVLGSALRLGAAMRTIVGVLPRGVDFPSGTAGPVVYAPMSLLANGPRSSGITPATLLPDDFALALARLRPGVSIPQAIAQTRALLIHDHDPDGVESRRLTVESIAQSLTDGIREPLLALLGGVAILLLIACANAANLQIARAAERLPEMQVRAALGASFSRLLQQLLIESLVVSLSGALIGAVLAVAATAGIRTADSLNFPRFSEVAVHPGVLCTISLLAVVAGLLASLAPAFSIRHRTVAAAGARRTTTSRNRLSGLLVALQIALTCVLLVTCGLLLRTFRALEQVPLGFDPHHVTTLVLMPEDSRQPPTLLRQTNLRLLERFESLPGVQSAAIQTAIPFSSYGSTLDGGTDVSGRPLQKGDSAFYSIVSSSFVRASGLRLLQGRDFQRSDDSSGAIAVLVNQAFVDKFLPGRNPIGVTLRMHRDPGDKDSDIPLTQSMTVIGVVQNEVQGNALGSEFEPMVYLNVRQLPADSAFLELYSMMSQFAIRSPLPQDVLDREIRAALLQVAPGMAEMELRPMQQDLENSLGQRRLALRLVSGFGAISLLLAAIGIYSLLAYAVTLRRREIGIRMALGSSRAHVTRLVLRQAARMILWGFVPGIAGAWLAARAVRSFLFGVRTLDPLTIAAVAAVLAFTAAVAAAVPSWRAARVDPMEVLRVD